MPDRDHLTTGEAARMLGVSASTVIRRFDEGRLTGRRNPVTGRRYIARASVAVFMEAYTASRRSVSASHCLILAADTDEATPGALRAALDRRAGVRVRTVHHGCEVCGRVLEHRPDLVIINADLPDMSGRDVVRCLRHLPGLRELPVVLCSPPHVSVSDRELQGLGADAYLRKPWRLEELRATLERLLPRGGPGYPRPPRNRRKWPRTEADWRADLTVHLDSRAPAFDRGSARVRNISRGGALLSDIRLKEGRLAAGPFTLGLRLADGAAQGLSLRCRPVRTETNGDVRLGVEFLGLAPAASERIAHALGA